MAKKKERRDLYRNAPNKTDIKNIIGLFRKWRCMKRKGKLRHQSIRLLNSPKNKLPKRWESIRM